MAESRQGFGTLKVFRSIMAQLIAATKITKEFKMFKVAATWLVKTRETVVSSNFITEKVTRN